MDRHPHQSEVDYLEELGARVEVNGATGESTAAPVLDAGRFGLEFFHRFGPAYTALAGADGDARRDRRYDTHHGIAYAKLRADAERHEQVSAALTERILDMRNGASPVFEAWQGDAAGRAKSSLDGLLARAAAVRDTFAGLAEVLGAAVDAADRAVYQQAWSVAGLWADRVGARTAEDVDFLVDFGRRCATGDPALVTDDELRRAADHTGLDVSPAACRVNPTVFAQLARDVRGWLDTTFVPFYRERAQAFDSACRTADEVIDGAWQTVTAKLDAVPADPFQGLVIAQAATPSPAGRDGSAQAQPTQPQAAQTQPAAADARADGSADDLPDTPADRAGGITSALDGPTEGSADAPDTAMHPAGGAAPGASPTIPAAASTGAGGGGQGQTNFYGTPFFGAGANRGGGDVEHKRGVHLAGPPTVDAPTARPGHVIGAAGDPGRYNDDGVKEAEEKPVSRLERELREQREQRGQRGR